LETNYTQKDLWDSHQEQLAVQPYELN